MTASSKPTVLTPYPLAQQCSPVQLRVRPRYARCMRMAAFPCKRPTACATLYLGGMRRHTGPWSGLACPSTHSRPIGLQSSRSILPMSLRSVPQMALCRYCGTMTMGYRQYHRTWLWLCHARIVVSPACGLGGSTLGETTVLFTHQRRNGRACASLTARGGGLPIGVNLETGKIVAVGTTACLGVMIGVALEDGWHQTEPSPQRLPRDVQVVKETRPRFPGMVYIPT